MTSTAAIAARTTATTMAAPKDPRRWRARARPPRSGCPARTVRSPRRRPGCLRRRRPSTPCPSARSSRVHRRTRSATSEISDREPEHRPVPAAPASSAACHASPPRSVVVVLPQRRASHSPDPGGRAAWREGHLCRRQMGGPSRVSRTRHHRGPWRAGRWEGSRRCSRNHRKRSTPSGGQRQIEQAGCRSRDRERHACLGRKPPRTGT